MAIMGLPDQVKVYVAPAYGRVQMSIIPSGAWVDISNYVTKITINRGTNHELQLPDAGELQLELKNFDGRLTPATAQLFPSLNIGGWSNSNTLFPNGVIEMPVRVTATANGTTYNRFSGYVSKFGPDNFSNSDWITIELVAYDAMKAATDAYIPSTYLGQQYMQHNPVYWYACNDTATVRTARTSLQNYAAYDSTGNNNPGNFGTVNDLWLTATFAQSPAPVYNLQATNLTCSSAGNSVVSGSGPWWFNFLLALDNSTSIQSLNPMLLASCHNGLGGWAITAEYSIAKGGWFLTFRGYTSTGANSITIQSTTPIAGKVTQMATLTYNSGVFSFYFDGLLVGTSSASIMRPAAQISIMGASGPGNKTYAPWFGGIGDIALGQGALTSTQIGDTTSAANKSWWGFVYPIRRTTAQWINLMLDNMGACGLDRSVSTSDVSPSNTYLIQPDAMTGNARTIREALEQAVLDEVGQLFVDGSGKFVFHDRSYAPTNSTPKAYFGTIPTSALGSAAVGYQTIPIVKATISDSDQDLWTHVQGSRSAGNPIIVATSRATSIPGRTGGYGIKTFRYPGSFNLTQDSDVLSALNYVASKYSAETVRVTDLQVRPWVKGVGSSSTDWNHLLALEIWNTIGLYLKADVQFGGAFEGPLLVEGIKDEIDFETGDWVMTLQTAPAWSSHPFFMVDTTTLDSTPLAL